MSLLTVGTVAFDSIETPFGKADRVVGGACTYISLAASYFTKDINLVSVVGADFPEAELKLFMTASPEKRAMRRYKELIDKGDKVAYEDVLRNVQSRDYIDSHREDSPLRQAEGAVSIDNSDMGLKEQFERIMNLAQRTINA